MKTIKHDHLLTKLLKVGIFSLMMLLPFIIWLPNAFYYGFNETAVAQKRTEQEPIYYESNIVENSSDLISGRIYKWLNNYSLTLTETNKAFIGVENNSLMQSIGISSNATDLMFYSNSQGSLSLRYYYNNNYRYFSLPDTSFNFVITNIYNVIPDELVPYFSISNLQYIKEYESIDYSMSITDSMSVAWQSVWDNNLMSWTNNSIIKTPIDNFIGVFAINSDAYISNYLIYLMTLTAIYVVIDIVLELFITLTHMFSRDTK